MRRPGHSFVVGERWGRLVVLAKWAEMVQVRCDCGVEKCINYYTVTKPRGVRSCGCLSSEVHAASNRRRFTTHGMTKSDTYKCWENMRDRCNNPKNVHFDRYGGRGITICERWNSFANFLADMGPRPPGLTIDRRDNSGHYEPNNCGWATRKEQAANRDCRMFEYQGVALKLSQWAERLQVSHKALRNRLDRGWPIDRAFHTPVQSRRSKAP